MKKLRIIDLTTMEYPSAMEFMHTARSEVERGEDDTLLLVEHKAVVTIGVDGDETSIVDREYIHRHGIPVIRTDRGGDSVVHNAGQLVAYPIVKVRKGPVDMVGAITDAIVDVVSGYGLKAEVGKEPGVWVSGQKLGFVGLKIEHGVSVHGIAINVANDLGPFGAIKTCGIENEKVTNLTLAAKRFIAVDEVKHRFISKFSRRFEYMPDRFIIREGGRRVI